MKKFILRLSVLIAVLIAALYITDTDYLLKAVRTIYAKGYTTAYLEDYKEFNNVVTPDGLNIDYEIDPEWARINLKNTVTIAGGQTRQESTFKALKKIKTILLFKSKKPARNTADKKPIK